MLLRNPLVCTHDRNQIVENVCPGPISMYFFFCFYHSLKHCAQSNSLNLMKVHISIKNMAGRVYHSEPLESAKSTMLFRIKRIIAQFKFSSHFTVQCINFQLYIYMHTVYAHRGQPDLFHHYSTLTLQN